jgi:hypothetical protein
MKITNIKNLGSPYHVLDSEGNQVDVIIVEKQDFLDALDFPKFDITKQSYVEYFADCRARVRGNDFKYSEILWYTTTFEHYDLHDVFALCLYSCYNYVIVELALTEAVE